MNLPESITVKDVLEVVGLSVNAIQTNDSKQHTCTLLVEKGFIPLVDSANLLIGSEVAADNKAEAMFWKFYQNKYRVQECIVTSIDQARANVEAGTWLEESTTPIVMLKKLKVHANGSGNTVTTMKMRYSGVPDLGAFLEAKRLRKSKQIKVQHTPKDGAAAAAQNQNKK